MLSKFKENRKKIVVVFVCLMAVIIAVTVGVIVYRNSDKVKVKNYLEMGSKYLSEMQYEQAIVEFTKAFELDPDNPVVTGNLVTAYSDWADALVEEENYDKAIEILTQGYELTGDESLNARITEIRGTLKAISDKNHRDILYALTAKIHDGLAGIGIAGMPSSGRYRTFDEKREVFMPVINDLNDYIEKMDLYSDQVPQEQFPVSDVDAYCNGLTTATDVDLPAILTPGYVYAALSVCYLHIGEMENCLNARTKLAEAIGDKTILNDHFDSSGDTEYDKYGRTLRSISGGFSFGYSDESANNETRSETEYSLDVYEYENGRMISDTQTSVGLYHYYTYSYQGDTVNVECYSDIGVMQYDTSETFQIDKYGNNPRDTEMWAIAVQ